MFMGCWFLCCLLLFLLLTWLFSLRTEQVAQVCLDSKAGFDGLFAGVGCHFGSINVQLFSPNESSVLALFDNRFKEATKNIDPKPFTNTGETGMIRKRLTQVIAKVPPDAQSISGMAHQLPF